MPAQRIRRNAARSTVSRATACAAAGGQHDLVDALIEEHSRLAAHTPANLVRSYAHALAGYEAAGLLEAWERIADRAEAEGLLETFFFNDRTIDLHLCNTGLSRAVVRAALRRVRSDLRCQSSRLSSDALGKDFV